MAGQQKRRSEQERVRILSAVKHEGLTGKQASKMFGVNEVTLWKWRRDAKGTRRALHPRAPRSMRASAGALDGVLRLQIRARLEQVLPEVVRAEVLAYLNDVLGPSRPRR